MRTTLKAFDVDTLQKICDIRSNKARDAFEYLKQVVNERSSTDWIDPELRKAWRKFTLATAKHEKLAQACSIVEAALEHPTDD